MGSRKLSHPAPLAVASDGSVLLNLAAAHGADTERALASARAEGRPIFVGIQLTSSEARRVKTRMAHAGSEAAALIVGGQPKATASNARKRRA